MGANIAGIYGAQIFRKDDKPRYRRGFSINIAVLTLGLSLAAVRYIDDRIRRRRNGGKLPSEQTLNDEDEYKEAPPSDALPPPVLIDDKNQPVVPKVMR
jgi:hypothetical protein